MSETTSIQFSGSLLTKKGINPMIDKDIMIIDAEKSISKNNISNLAPFSFHNAFSSNPPIIGISPAFSGRTGKSKDTLINCRNK